jgi:trimeric autotransporter adhesin
MALNYKKFAEAQTEYGWIGESIINTTWVQGTLTPYDPAIFYYWKPISLDLTLNPEYTSIFYKTVNQSPNNGFDSGNVINNVPSAKDWLQAPSQIFTATQKTQIDGVVQQWNNVIDLNNINKNVTWAYIPKGFLAQDPLVPFTLQSSGRTYIGGGAHQNDNVIFIAADLTFTGSTASTNDLSVGTWGGWMAMHELGHVFGFTHPDPLLQDLRNTIMAYPVDGFASNKIPLTPGMRDIDWLQHGHAGITAIGESHAQDGDTTYKFTQSTVDLGHGNIIAGVANADIKNYVMTLWDRAGGAGGIDTIDASTFGPTQNLYIDLREGHFSAIGTLGTNAAIAPGGADLNADGDPDGNTDYNVGIAVGAAIENAKGGSGNDYFKGNDLANVLEGNGGADTLNGGLGNDTLKGGDGNDTYIYKTGDGFDTIEDSDNTGLIDWNGSPTAINGGAQIGDNRVFESADKLHTYVYITGDKDAGGDLAIDSTFLVKNHQGLGSLGINFTGLSSENSAIPTIPATTREIGGDHKPAEYELVVATGALNGLDPSWVQYKPKVPEQIAPDGITVLSYRIFYNILDGIYNLLPGASDPGRIDSPNTTDGADHIATLAGNDIVHAKGGNDYIEAGVDDDQMWGDGGNDYIDGGSGKDKLYGDIGMDVIIGGTDTDILSGGAENDKLYAGIVPVTMQDAISNGNTQSGSGVLGDWLAGGDGDDQLFGGTGNDVLTGGDGKDTLIGGAGDDDILGDRPWVATSFTWTITIQNGVRIYSPTDSQSTPTVGGADLIYAGSGYDWVYAGFGNDIVFGEGNDDTLIGEEGDDILIGGEGNDKLYGDAPYLPDTAHGNDVLYGGAGNDTLVGGAGDDVLDGGSNADEIVGGKGNDVLVGGIGNDKLFGLENNDTLKGGEGQDELYGGEGDDVLIGTGDGDILSGGAGKDIVYFSNGDKVQGQDEFDTNNVNGGSSGTSNTTGGKAAAANVSLNPTISASAINLNTDGGQITFIDGLVALGDATYVFNDGTTIKHSDLVGNTLNSAVSIGSDAKMIYGGKLDDILAATGIIGSTVFGGLGNDYIESYSGANKFIGGKGNDSLRGGGSNVYEFSVGDGNDYIWRNDVLGVTIEPGFDTVKFTNIKSTQINSLVYNSFNQLVINYGVSDSVSISGVFQLNSTTKYYQFSDGVTFTAAQLFSHYDLLGSAVRDQVYMYNNNLLDFDLSFKAGAGDDTVVLSYGNNKIYGEAGNDRLEIYNAFGNNLLDGGDGNDTLVGGNYDVTSVNGRDTLLGGTGNDTLYGWQNDRLVGGIGNDYVSGGLGSVYVFTKGDGLDVVHNSDLGTIQFTDVMSTEITNVNILDDNRLVISYGLNDSITVDGAFYDTLSRIKTYSFSDGVNLNASQFLATHVGLIQLSNSNNTILANTATTDVFGGINVNAGGGDDTILIATGNNRINGEAGNDTLSGGAGNDTILGGIGNDSIKGGNGNNTIVGGAGNDSLSGDGGVNTYYLNKGDGNDVVTDLNMTQSLSTVKFTDVKFDEITATRTDALGQAAGNLLNIKINYGLLDNVVIDYGFNNLIQQLNTPLSAIGRYEFSDGMILDQESLARISMGTRFFGTTSADVLNGTVSGFVNDFITGNDGNDQINTYSGFDYLMGGKGNDTLNGGDGSDTYIFTKGDGLDTIVETFPLPGFSSSDVNIISVNGVLASEVTGLKVANNLQINYGLTDQIIIQDFFSYTNYQAFRYKVGGNDFDLLSHTIINGTNGNDIISGFAPYSRNGITQNPSSIIYGLDGDDDLRGRLADDQLFGGLGNDSLDGGLGNDTLSGGDGDDYISGGDGNNFLDGGAGADVISGGVNNDTIKGGSGNDGIYSGYGNDTYIFEIGDGFDSIVKSGAITSNDTLTFGQGILTSNIKITSAANDGINIEIIGNGDGVYLSNWQNASNVAKVTSIQFADGTIWNTNDIASRITVAVATNLDDTIYGISANDTINGLAGFDTIYGGAGNDLLIGGEGADFLVGGIGIDSLFGGFGDDQYDIDPFDVITEYNNEGNDTIWLYSILAGTTYTVGDYFENLYIMADGIGYINLNATGNTLDNLVYGDLGSNLFSGLAGNDTLNGGGGTDTLIGGLGSDRYEFYLGYGILQIDNTATDNATTIDTLFLYDIRAADLALSRIVDDLLISANATDKVTIKNYFAVGDNKIDQIIFYDPTLATETIWTQTDIQQHIVSSPTAGDDFLNGTAGNDVINALAGNDTVYGLAGNDSLIGGIGNDTLDGGAGIDTLVGGVGNDTFVIDVLTDVITENLNEGTDTVNVAITTAAGSYTVGTNLENATLTNTVAYNLTGNTLGNVLTGNAANNVLDGLGGVDTLIGGLGNDTYTIDVLTDVITENLNEGTDLVNVAIATAAGTYTVAANVENATLTNTVAYNLTGNGLNNTLIGNAVANIIDGGLGIDTMTGGLGNDTYTVDDALDVVTETSTLATEIDLVQASASYVLGANLEKLTLTGTTNINATGNGLANTLTGNAGNNVLNGLVGADTMIGGLGSDIYTIDATTDVVTENLNEGTDLVNVAIATAAGTYIVATNVENATLTNTVAYNLTGNTLGNVLTGSAANNVLDGLGGVDTLIGGLGNDTYTIDVLTDVITENLNEGTDLVNVAIATAAGTYTVAANVENATLTNTVAYNLTGNGLNNTLIGNAVANIIDGGLGIDTMTGGLGNDTYTVDDALDVVTETSTLATEIDLVQASASYVLGTNLEKLTLTGIGNINATGNALANTLTGNTGNNILNGLVGNDSMSGGLGNDTYTIDVLTDVITENLNEGTDLVNVAIATAAGSYTVAANVENATLTNTVAYTLIGNALDNVLIGNAVANTLTGAAGNDTLNGLAGNDSMLGGLGNDTYTIDVLTDVITENLNEGTDLVNVAIATAAGTYTVAANVENATLTNTVAYNLIGNALNNLLIGNGANNILTGGVGTDVLTGGLGADTFDFNLFTESLVGTSRDIITDFSRLQLDKIDLSTIDANTVLAADQAFAATILTTGAFTSIGQLRLVGDVLSGNTDNNFATAEFEIQLTGITSMTSVDFIL